jgi:chitin disaccharide deacetylase
MFVSEVCMGRRLIVNADDYGRAPGVCQGILEAHRSGIVTSTTVMINQPGIEDHLAAALARPGLGVGLHLVFTAGKPLLPVERVPGLVDRTGHFLDQHTVWARAERLPVAELRQELAAQVQRFAALAGHLPDHLDCHHFVHLYPPFFQVYADLATEYGLPLRVPFPVEADFRVAAGALPYLEEFPKDLVRGMIVTNSSLLRARKLVYPDHFVGAFFGRRALELETLFRLLAALPAGTSELMCHPGYDDPALAGSSYRSDRELELALLTDPRVRAQVDALDIELVTFGILQGAGRHT